MKPIRGWLLVRFVILAVSISFGASLAKGNSAQKLTFERDDFVWVANIDGSSAKKIAAGQCPDLSPDGMRLAYVTDDPGKELGPQKIAVADLGTGTTTVLKDIPSDRCSTTFWSPDGKQLLVQFIVDSDSHLGLVNADGTGFRNVRDPAAGNQDFWSVAWAPDGQSIFVQDMENLYRLDLDGKVLKKWVIEKLVPGGSMSSDIRLDCSPDGKTLLMDVEMDEKERDGWDGPPPSIWTLDLATDKATRLTPKSLYGWESHWLDAPNSILFISLKAGEKDTAIYRMSVSGKGADKKLLVKNARYPGTSL